MWRGGKRFKPAAKAPPKEKQNGFMDDSIMIIDSDDDEPSAPSKQGKKFEDKPQFEDGIDDLPYPEVVQTLDLTLGTAVLNIAVMPMAGKAASEVKPAILGEKMVFAVSCVTNDVYIITLPLTPPSPASKARPELRQDLLAGMAGSGMWGETLTLLGGQRALSQGIAMNVVTPTSSSSKAGKPRIVVAAHSKEASGLLRLWEIPLEEKMKYDAAIEPFQTEYLPRPLSSVSFNPTHTTQLLAISPSQGARIYDFAQPSLPDPDTSGAFPSQGSWLLTLYQPFTRASSSRKPILDAAWIAHGRAVFVLLADGMWGIWDIDGASPSSVSGAVTSKLKSGVRGAALTVFSVSGYVEGTSSLRSVGSQQRESTTGEFAPMTPHTRRQVASTLGSAATQDRLAAMHGGVRVTALPSAGNTVQDESLALWLGGYEHVCVIPGVSRFWDSQLRKGPSGGVNLFSGAQPTRMVKLHDISTGLLGERCCGVSLISEPSQSREASAQDGGLPVDVLIQGETRLVVVREGDDGPSKKLANSVGRSKRLFADKSNAIIVRGSQRDHKKLDFNLSTFKPGTLRLRHSIGNADDERTESNQVTPKASTSRAHPGFDFGSAMDAAADEGNDDVSRDLEVEMLDIMEIDKALENMGGKRESGRKKVLFEED